MQERAHLFFEWENATQHSIECIFKDNGIQPQVISLNQLPHVLIKIEGNRTEVQNPLLEVNLWTQDDPELIFISALLYKDVKKGLNEFLIEIALLRIIISHQNWTEI